MDTRAPGRTLYRTGDVVRLLSDGNLEYQRRNDDQVKVRGYRIELAELELALQSHPSVRQAVAAVREDRPGDTRLIAYLLKTSPVTDSELRAHLRKSLPEYFIPQRFVELEQLPLTLNGKVDRKALPPPDGELQRDAPHVPPEGPTEVLVARLWRELLELDGISAHDNFFALGGHSLLALQLISALERETGTRIKPRVLLLSSLRQVAAQLPPAARVETVRAEHLDRSPTPRRPLEKSTLGSILRKAKRALRGD
jgi:acyl carrier protein